MSAQSTVVWTRNGSWVETRGEDGATKFAGLGKLTISQAEKKAFLLDVPVRIVGERSLRDKQEVCHFNCLRRNILTFPS